MTSSLSNLANNLAEGIHKIMKLYNVNTGIIIKNVKQCNETKISKKSLMKTLNINKFVLLLRKGVYPDEFHG